MTVYAIPPAMMSRLVGFDMQLTPNPVGINQSPMNRRIQTVENPGDKWIIRMEWPELLWREFRAHEAYWNGVRGPVHRVRLWNPINGGFPYGTLRGSPILGSAAGEGANTITVAGSAGATLLPGDFIGVTLADASVQLCQVRASTGTGTITTHLTAPLRAAANAGAVIQWNRPTVDCVVTSAMFPSFRSVVAEGYTVELLEQ